MTSEAVQEHWLRRGPTRVALGISGFFASLVVSWLIGAFAITASSSGIFGEPAGIYMIVLFISSLGLLGVGSSVRKEPDDLFGPFIFGSGIGSSAYLLLLILMIIAIGVGGIS